MIGLPPFSVSKNFGWTVFGNVVYAASQWATLAVLAHLTDPAAVGDFAFALAIAGPILMLANLQLRSVQVTDRGMAYAFGHYLALRCTTSASALAVIVVIASLGPYERRAAWVIIAVGVAKVTESISDIYYGLMQWHERLDLVSRSLSLRGVGSLIVVTVVLWWTRDVLWAAISISTAWMATLLLYDLPAATSVAQAGRVFQGPLASAADRMRMRFERGTMAQLAWLALPMGLVMALLSLTVNIPRYFLEASCGIEQLGIFAALSYVLVGPATAVNALGQAASPRLAQYYVDEDIHAFKRLLWILLGFGFLVGFGGVLVALFFGRPLLALVYGQAYADHVDTFVWLMIAGGVGNVASAFGYTLTAARRFKSQLPMYVLVTLTVLVLARLWVPERCLLGAAQAVFAAGVVQTGLAWVLFLRTVRKWQDRGVLEGEMPES